MKRAETRSCSLCNKLHISLPPHSCVRQVYTLQYSLLLLKFRAIKFSINIVQHQFSLHCFYFCALRTTNLFHTTKWLFIHTFTCSLIPCNTYRIALEWRHLLHQKSLHLQWSTQSAKSFLCFSSSSSSVVLDFQRTLFLLSSYLLSLRCFHEV